MGHSSGENFQDDLAPGRGSLVLRFFSALEATPLRWRVAATTAALLLAFALRSALVELPRRTRALFHVLSGDRLRRSAPRDFGRRRGGRFRDCGDPCADWRMADRGL